MRSSSIVVLNHFLQKEFVCGQDICWFQSRVSRLAFRKLTIIELDYYNRNIERLVIRLYDWYLNENIFIGSQ